MKPRPRSSFWDLQRVNRKRALVLAVILVVVLGGFGALLGAIWQSWLVGLLVGVGFAGIQYAIARGTGSELVMRAAGARPLARSEDPQLYNVVEEIAIAARMPAPKIYVVNDPTPNAFATGFKVEDGAVAITSGLRRKLERDELQAVMAHEIGHIRNGDSGYMVLMSVIVGSVAFLADIALRSLRYGAHGMRGSNKDKAGAELVLLLVVVVLAIIAPVFASILRAAISREREFLADASSVEFTRHPAALVSALEKLTRDPGSLAIKNRGIEHLWIVNPMRKARGKSGSWWSTHPPLSRRISRIQSLYSGIEADARSA